MVKLSNWEFLTVMITTNGKLNPTMDLMNVGKWIV